MLFFNHRVLRRSSLAAAAVALVSLAPSRASAQFSNLFFFGDSFTDTGNALNLSVAGGLGNPTPSPYLAGRFSNGPVWSELFAAKLGRANDAAPAWPVFPAIPTIPNTGNNYAVGGATTGLTGSFNSLTGMTSQAGVFQQQHPFGVAPNALYVLWGGGNDVLDAVKLSSPFAQLQAIKDAVQNIATIAGGLNQFYGAANFLIPSLPNIGASPIYANDPLGAATATSLSNTFNQLLAAAIQQYSVIPGVTVYNLSIDNLLYNVQYDAARGGQRYGITNATYPCFAPGAPSCNSSLFVDGEHGTAVWQQLVADAAYERVINGNDVAAIPEPATVVLVGGGLLIAGVAARRRRSA